jgi:hypothetical protein
VEELTVASSKQTFDPDWQVAEAMKAVNGVRDIWAYGGWRAYLAAAECDHTDPA